MAKKASPSKSRIFFTPDEVRIQLSPEITKALAKVRVLANKLTRDRRRMLRQLLSRNGPLTARLERDIRELTKIPDAMLIRTLIDMALKKGKGS